ncbi:MAG: SpoIIE family protein phosphatase [Oscillospiraceae bacterium]|jgi:stage II sporulation protein E|nr:SpoIIE family protein phosphatase [Oscillospiraceae bacterium]
MVIESAKAHMGLGGEGVTVTPEKLRRGLAFLAQELGAALLGALLAQSRFAGGAFQTVAPFAVALAAAGSVRFLGMEVLGAAAGCLLLLPYPACISAMAVAAVAGLFNLGFRKLGIRRKLFVPLCAFACSAVSGVICLLTRQPGAAIERGPMGWVNALCGAVLCACAAYFIVLAQSGLRLDETGFARRPQYRMTRRERAALLLCCSMAMASVGGFTIGLFRPMHILAVLFVLAAAHCWREAGGAVAGCCAGAALALAGDEPALTAVFALGGLLSGVFGCLHTEQNRPPRPMTGEAEKPARGLFAKWRGSSRASLFYHKDDSDFFAAPSALLTVPLAGGFALVCVFYLALRASNEADPADTVVFSIEALLAILLFILAPARFWNTLRRRFAAPEEVAFTPPENEAAVQLSQTAGALRKVGEYVEEVAQGLEKLQAPPEHGVYARASEEVCKQCPEYSYCHEEFGARAAILSGKLLKSIKRQGALTEEHLSLARRECGLTQPCRKPEEFRAALGRAYDMHCAKTTGAREQSQLRQAAAEQFDAISQLLEELSAKLARQKAFDAETAEAAARVLEDHGFRARSVVCSHGEEMAARLQARVLPEEGHSTREQLAQAIGRATGVDFAPPELSDVSEQGDSILSFAQRPVFALRAGAVQMSSSHSDYCGDYFDCFNDGKGREVMVISDGMGTGGRAAVDSALATEIFGSLVRSGLSFEGAVRIANQALLLKSCDESLATLDAAGVNLYTGEVEFCKAGGAASFLRRRGTASKIELSALPAGILRSIHPAQFRAMLEPGDLLVLVSDGMLCEEDRWLCDELELWQTDDMQALAERLAGVAVRRRQEASAARGREDDLTVICARLERG